MKLFKYVGLKKAREILTRRRIGFTLPRYLNDPFDIPMEPVYPAPTMFDEDMWRLHTSFSNVAWGLTSAVLSLTRSPTNALMWAHYGEQHNGVVIGIDMASAGLLDISKNMIPAHYGSMTYARRRMKDPYVDRTRPLSIGQMKDFIAADFEMLQRLFLVKPLEWAYEEEVRVVKSVGGLVTVGGDNGTDLVVDGGSGVRYYLPLPDGSITDVIFGAKSELVPDDFADRLDWKDAYFSQCIVDQDFYELKLKGLGHRLAGGGFA